MRALLFASVALAATALSGPAAAEIFNFEAFLDGPSEAAPNASPGTGLATLAWDDDAQTFTLDVTFEGLLGTTIASHVHAPTLLPNAGAAGVATQIPSFTGFPLGVTSGSYNHTFDYTQTSTWNAAYVAANGGTALGAADAFLAALQADKSYLNIHSSVFTGGEIRGFFRAVVPEPSTWALMILGFGAAGAAIRARRRPQVT